jgi:hypothetical protein
MKRLINIFIITLGLLSLSWSPALALAEEVGEVKANVSVDALVPTTACAQYSSFTANNSQILSDATQKITFTVLVKNCSEVPLTDALVTITSNRGAVDKVDNVDEDGNVIDTGDGVGISGKTDANGYAFFQGYSGVPGEAIFSANVDSQLALDQIKITFLPLPFPKSISVVVEVPRIISPSGIITIFKPKDFDVDRDKLVNMTMELRIPSWVFYLFIFVILLNTTMFATITALTIKIGNLQKVEIEHIEKEEEILAKEEKEIEKLAKDNGDHRSTS